ncbi:hypothetical protein PR002_g23259 [Phytophthora rubi]|uniref:BED-type domain-containing protein n=1 Tax=Phytophthora rubi TaxID=129364 RepID=A0A6A3IMW7_9STRA|nr:hypothetical protein PR002_g23259 [Phytophthora rubi]
MECMEAIMTATSSDDEHAPVPRNNAAALENQHPIINCRALHYPCSRLLQARSSVTCLHTVSTNTRPVYLLKGSSGELGRHLRVDEYVSRESGEPDTPPTPPNMYKIKKQRRKEMWGFIRLVRDDRFAEIPKKELHSDHARCAYCMVCEEEIAYKTGNTTAVGRHMNKFHEKVLVNFQKRLAAKRSSNGVAVSSGCACSTTGTC